MLPHVNMKGHMIELTPEMERVLQQQREQFEKEEAGGNGRWPIEPFPGARVTRVRSEKGVVGWNAYYQERGRPASHNQQFLVEGTRTLEQAYQKAVEFCEKMKAKMGMLPENKAITRKFGRTQKRLFMEWFDREVAVVLQMTDEERRECLTIDGDEVKVALELLRIKVSLWMEAWG